MYHLYDNLNLSFSVSFVYHSSMSIDLFNMSANVIEYTFLFFITPNDKFSSFLSIVDILLHHTNVTYVAKDVSTTQFDPEMESVYLH